MHNSFIKRYLLLNNFKFEFMNEFAKKLQQMQIVISYWTNQAIFVMTGENEAEQLGVGFEQRKATISKMEGQQAELLRIFVEVEGNLYGKLRVICERIGQTLKAVLDGAACDDRRKYNNLVQEVEESYKRLYSKVHAL